MIHTSFSLYAAFTVLASTGFSFSTALSLNPRPYNKHIVNTLPHFTLNLRGGQTSEESTGLMGRATSRPSKIEKQDLKRFKMYVACAAIVLIWVGSGTLFYSWFYKWPLAQSFFYAVDAGMSIGFCTDVRETEVASRAFTIVLILLGASCVGGALYLFIEDVMEGIDESSHREYKQLLEQDAFLRADRNGTGMLTIEEFRDLIQADGHNLSEDDLKLLWNKFDRSKRGFINEKDFVAQYRAIHKLLRTSGALYSKNNFVRIAAQVWEGLKGCWNAEYRIYSMFVLWITMGVCWGVVSQNWDPITAMHFAISALATGGLTAPPVAEDGVLPAKAAVFCGVYCLFGIPLFYLTLGHYARLLVEGHAKAREQKAISKPLSKEEFEFAKHLCTTDSVVHLSDFIVLQFLRQGKTSLETLKLIKKQFEFLDSDHSGTLTLEQATATQY